MKSGHRFAYLRSSAFICGSFTSENSPRRRKRERIVGPWSMKFTMRIATDTTAEYTSPTANDSMAAPVNDRRRRARLLGKSTGWVFLGDDDHAPAREITVTDVSRLGVG